MTNDRSNAFEPVKLRRVISAWCDGAIEPAEYQWLHGLLEASREARLIYLEYMEIHSGVKGQVAAQEYLESLMPGERLPKEATDADGNSSNSSGLRFPQWRVRPTHLGLWAAGLLIAIAGWKLFASRPVLVPGHPAAPVAARKYLARVTDQSADCRWNREVGAEGPNLSGDLFYGGETIRVASGVMNLSYANGTNVTLYGPALYQLISDMKAQVLLGRVTADVAEDAKGFSILTPRATVVDLGTRFGVSVSDAGSTDVVVFKGFVDVNMASTDQTSERQRRLSTGEAVHVDTQGTESRIVAIDSRWFPNGPDNEAAGQPTISAVRDNIERGTTWKYYEIVYGGMREDAKAYVDRESHEWNGITRRGMPKYLLGGDYVKTFNIDKTKSDIEIRVTLDRPAKLYVLFDTRIPAPAWLQKDFRNTGDRVGVDEGPYWTRGRWYEQTQPGVGAGVSVDHTSAIWVREVKSPGVVTLGPTGTPTTGINMYGIVAVPLDSKQRN